MIIKMMRQYFLFSWAFCSLLTFVLGATIYWTLLNFFKSYLPWGNPYGAMYRMHAYHYEYPYQYWAILSVTFGFIASFWLNLSNGKNIFVRLISSLITFPVAVLLASIPGSMLWAFHDMQAGFFKGISGSFDYMISWIPTGMQVGFVIMVNSWPLNLILISIALILLHLTQLMFSADTWGNRS